MGRLSFTVEREDWIAIFPSWSIFSLLKPLFCSRMSFFKFSDSYRIQKSPVEHTDSDSEFNSPAPANAKKKRIAFGQPCARSLDILSILIDFQPPSWLGKLNKSSRLSIQPGEYFRGKSITHRFDGAVDEPKLAARPPILPRPKGRSSTHEEQLANLFQDLFLDQSLSTKAQPLDDSPQDDRPLPVPSTPTRRRHHSTSSESIAGPSLKGLRSSDSVRSSCSLKSLDRFLPRRPALNSAATNFRANKDPQSLSPEERLLRHSGASSDPFNRRRRATSPTPQSSNPTARRNTSTNRSGGAGKDRMEAVCKHI